MRLIKEEDLGGRKQRWWFHYGSDGKPQLSVETIQDVEPVFDHVKRQSEHRDFADMKYRGSIPANVLEEAAKIKSRQWGEAYLSVFQEIMGGKTDRSRRVWRELLYGRDFRKFQAQ